MVCEVLGDGDSPGEDGVQEQCSIQYVWRLIYVGNVVKHKDVWISQASVVYIMIMAG